MSKVLLKYKNLSLLVDSEADVELFIKCKDQILKLNEAYVAFMRNIINMDKSDSKRIEDMRNDLKEFIIESGVIGAPFDIQNAELFALSNKIEYQTLELE